MSLFHTTLFILILSCLKCNNITKLDRWGAGIAEWYSARLRNGWSGVRVPVGAGNFCLHHRIQTGSGAHPASYPIDTWCPFPGRESDHSLPSSAEDKNAWNYASIPQYAFMAWCWIEAQGRLYIS
jgi:hypothetical protein